jgi:hypothetical protein
MANPKFKIQNSFHLRPIKQRVSILLNPFQILSSAFFSPNGESKIQNSFHLRLIKQRVSTLCASILLNPFQILSSVFFSPNGAIQNRLVFRFLSSYQKFQPPLFTKFLEKLNIPNDKTS